MEDYDYVNLESRESVARQHAEIREALPAELRKSYDVLVREAESAAVTNNDKKPEDTLDPNDMQVRQRNTSLALKHMDSTPHIKNQI